MKDGGIVSLDDDDDHHPSVTHIRNPHPHPEERGNPRGHTRDRHKTDKGAEERRGSGGRGKSKNTPG